MSVFDDAVTDAMKTLKGVVGVEVKYYRGNNFVKLCALPGKTDFLINDGSDQGYTKIRTRDYLITACELTINGSQTVPTKGDKIVETIGNIVNTYDVLRPDGNEQLYRTSDIGGKVLRVHTKLKNSVLAS